MEPGFGGSVTYSVANHHAKPYTNVDADGHADRDVNCNLDGHVDNDSHCYLDTNANCYPNRNVDRDINADTDANCDDSILENWDGDWRRSAALEFNLRPETARARITFDARPYFDQTPACLSVRNFGSLGFGKNWPHF